MATQRHLKPITDNVISVTPNETKDLIQLLNGLKIANKSLPPSALKFVLKNLKKLSALFEKMIGVENEHRKTYPSMAEYCKLTEQGFVLFSNFGKPKEEELKPGEFHLIEAYFDKETKNLIDTSTGLPVDPKDALKLTGIFLSDEKKEEYLAATKAYQEKRNEILDAKSDCHVVFISYKFLDENKISVPTQVPLDNGQIAYPDAQLFYDNLVPDWDKEDNK